MILPYGGNTNRLVAGHMLAAPAVASYGFAQSLYEYLKRYLPAQLMVGLIRPVVVARWARERSFPAIAEISSQVVLINVLLIGGGVLAAAGIGLFLFSPSHEASKGSVSLQISPGIQGGHVSLSGSF